MIDRVDTTPPDQNAIDLPKLRVDILAHPDVPLPVRQAVVYNILHGATKLEFLWRTGDGSLSLTITDSGEMAGNGSPEHQPIITAVRTIMEEAGA